MAKKKKEKKKSKILTISIIGIIIIAFIVSIFLIFNRDDSSVIFDRIDPTLDPTLDLNKPAIGIIGYYDKDGNEITQGVLQSIVRVGGVDFPNVKYIRLGINAINQDTVPLTFSITSLQPQVFSSSVSTTPFTINPGETASWKSNQIDISVYENDAQKPVFTVEIQAEHEFRKTVTKLAWEMVIVSPDVEPNNDYWQICEGDCPTDCIVTSCSYTAGTLTGEFFYTTPEYDVRINTLNSYCADSSNSRHFLKFNKCSVPL